MAKRKAATRRATVTPKQRLSSQCDEKYLPELSGNKYFKKIRSKEGLTVTIDVYAVLRAYKVDDPAIGHAVKKLLMPGCRGFKTQEDDLKEAIVAIQEAIADMQVKEAVTPLTSSRSCLEETLDSHR